MKRQFLISGLCLLALAGCTKNLQTNDNELVPIRLGAQFHAQTKAPVNPGDAITAGIAGWEAQSTPDYASTASDWNTTVDVAAGQANSQSVTWTAQKYYNADPSVATYLRAWYPAGSYADRVVTFSNTTGDQDVMLTAVVDGNRSTNGNLTLNFEHKTSQINFKIVQGQGFTPGTTLEKIEIVSAELPTGINLKSANGSLTYAAGADLTVPGISSQAIPSVAGTAGNPVMIRPFGATPFTIKVTTSADNYAPATVTLTNSKGGTEMLAGDSYVITITFGSKGIGLDATIQPWKEASGSVDII